MNLTLKNSLLVFFGCGLGGLLRYWITVATYSVLGRNFPYGTLIVNVSGSFLASLGLVLLLERYHGIISSTLFVFLLVGFLGGYTTFSSFSVETVSLIELGKYYSAIANIFLSVSMCVGTAWLGIWLGRSL